MRILIVLGVFLAALAVAEAQDAMLLESARQLRDSMAKFSLQEDAVKVLTLENRRLRAQVEAVAAQCP